MERLTLASLQHLPTAVLFVADLTGECGTTVADQWAIRWATCIIVPRLDKSAMLSLQSKNLHPGVTHALLS